MGRSGHRYQLDTFCWTSEVAVSSLGRQAHLFILEKKYSGKIPCNLHLSESPSLLDNIGFKLLVGVPDWNSKEKKKKLSWWYVYRQTPEFVPSFLYFYSCQAITLIWGLHAAGFVLPLCLDNQCTLNRQTRFSLSASVACWGTPRSWLENIELAEAAESQSNHDV